MPEIADGVVSLYLLWHFGFTMIVFTVFKVFGCLLSTNQIPSMLNRIDCVFYWCKTYIWFFSRTLEASHYPSIIFMLIQTETIQQAIATIDIDPSIVKVKTKSVIPTCSKCFKYSLTQLLRDFFIIVRRLDISPKMPFYICICVIFWKKRGHRIFPVG